MFATVDKQLEQHAKLPINYEKANWLERKIARKRYVEKQMGRCFYCNTYLHVAPAAGVLKKKVDKSLFPEGFFDNAIHLHHNHDTGMTIGVVHAYCNAVLWEYEGE